MPVIGNGRMITRDENAPFFEDGAVAFRGAEICCVGTTRLLREAFPDEPFIDARGGIIMPAFVNPHEHIYSSMARGMPLPGYQPKSFEEILEGLWWRIDRSLTLEQVRHSARATFLECIRNGVTTVFDHHASFGHIRGSLATIEETVWELGVRACLCFEVSDRAGQESMDEAIAENASFLMHAQKDRSGRVAGMMGLHASFTLSDETLERCVDAAPEGTGFHIHVAEGPVDQQQCLAQHGMRVVQRLHRHGILGPRTLAVHCIDVDRNELDLLQDTDTMVVHNPGSNMANACGCPPVLEIVRRGILTGLGTDGYTHDMTESYRTANLLLKHHHRDAGAGWDEVPAMLFGGNPSIAGRFFHPQPGILRAGAAADIIVLDYIPHTPMDACNCNAHILFGMSGRNVVTTVCMGNVLMQDRVMKGIDEERMLAEVRGEAWRLWQGMNTSAVPGGSDRR